MSNTNPPRKNQAFTFKLGLDDMAVIGSLKSAPTLAAGDFKVEIDDGGANDLATLPTASGVRVKVALSAAEMNGDVITITGIDQTSPKEWADFFLCVLTTT